MRRSRAASFLAAAIVYLGVALWQFRAVLPGPATLLPENPHVGDTYVALGRLDLTMVLWVVTGNAERMLTRPAHLRAEGQCHPLPQAYTLGEHMLGPSLLATMPLALTGDPIATYNAMLVLTLWIPGIAMFLCARHFTRSDPAAFVAGLLFCLEPGRIRDSGHPFIHGDLWAPLALLFLHRTFARGGLANALGCAVFLGLTVLESLYALLGVLLVLAAYGTGAVWRFRRDAARWLPPLAVAAALVAGIAFVVLRPYLQTRATWDVLVREGTSFMPPDQYAPGGQGFPGCVLLVLVAVALADRMRRRRDEEGEDPRWALLGAAVLVVWSSMRTLPIAGLELPSPVLALKQVVPGLDAVRAMASVGRVAVLPAALLAGYGVLVITERRSRALGAGVAALLGVLVMSERWLPALAVASFGGQLDLAAFRARPPDADIELLRAHARGAILDLPHGGGSGSVASGSYLMLESFSARPVATCYNSFPSPLAGQVSALAAALPRASAVDALVALGFETLLLRADRMEPKRVRFFTDLIDVDQAIAERLQLLGQTDRLLLFRMRSPVPVDHDPALLAAHVPEADTRTVEPGRRTLELGVANPTARIYAQSPPIAPLPVEARWHDGAGRVAHVERTRAILPIALAPGATARVTLALDVPAQAGNYDLTIALADAPETPLAVTRVTVASPAP
ncbi:MAG: hypothetical protein FJ148_18345 [Deltaproteobacteria bacterium]|nr:hypothetical protein [Deltaproteobacteria bacterium]